MSPNTIADIARRGKEIASDIDRALAIAHARKALDCAGVPEQFRRYA